MSRNIEVVVTADTTELAAAFARTARAMNEAAEKIGLIGQDFRRQMRELRRVLEHRRRPRARCLTCDGTTVAVDELRLFAWCRCRIRRPYQRPFIGVGLPVSASVRAAREAEEPKARGPRQ